MSGFVNTFEVLGDEETVARIISRTITEFKDDQIDQVGAYTFYGCATLRNVDLPKTSTIEANAFGSCSALLTMVLRGSNVATLGSNALVSTPIASGSGYVYVPSGLIDSYKSATNWSLYADQFRALENYTVDGTSDSELDETKI